MHAADYEKLGLFYLGRPVDEGPEENRQSQLLYESKDLCTHAVCVGMTGSGKTGLCVALLEEAALDGIPALVIDPKGDLGNLALTFPQLKPSSFRPWIDESEAARKGCTPDEYAEKTASTWKQGLADWGQSPSRIKALRAAAEVAIYTPGSTAGRPLTVLKSFNAPPPALRDDTDAVRDRIQAAVSGLLAMLGLEADPLQSREHILLSNILQHAWTRGQDLDLPGMIRAIQEPPFTKLGVFELDTFYPPKDRFALAMRLNNMLAAPGFETWMEGEPLDIQRLLWTPEGKPRLAILSIAHLSDAERMFFVTLVLNETLAWMRAQPGTSSLRAILYMDEIFGYFPPTANPPSKGPMLTLLKQARAFGLGCVLATQNPVDLDYKGLSNTGTWFIGRLQTERDKMRVLDGLEGAGATTGQHFDRAAMERTLAGLGKRVFLMNNVHDDEPVRFKTRWVMSYLRGPLTRVQIEQLTAAAPPPVAPPLPGPAGPVTPPPVLTAEPVSPAEPSPAPLPPAGIKQRFLAAKRELPAGGRMVYRPVLRGGAKLHFVRSTAKVDTWEALHLLAPLPAEMGPVTWEDASLFTEKPAFTGRGAAGAAYAELPIPATSKKLYSTWERGLKTHLYQAHTLTVYKCENLKVYSKPNEVIGDFKARMALQAREARDLALAKLKEKYATRTASANERIRKSQERIDREKSQYRSTQLSTAVSFGTTLLGALLGRKAVSSTSVSRAGTAIRGVGRASKDKEDISRAREDLAAQEQKLAELNRKFQAETETIKTRHEAGALEITEIPVRPRKSDILVTPLELAWTPWSVDTAGIAEPLF